MNIITKFKVCLIAVFVFNIFAGQEADNGGDNCERRIQLVRNDINHWIKNNGHQHLYYPSNLNHQIYKEKMLDSISNAVVSCTNKPLYVSGVEKTCKNYFQNDGPPMLVCNTDRFYKTNSSDQYVLIHHEYAGISGFEVNNGNEESQYFLSN